MKRQTEPKLTESGLFFRGIPVIRTEMAPLRRRVSMHSEEYEDVDYAIINHRDPMRTRVVVHPDRWEKFTVGLSELLRPAE